MVLANIQEKIQRLYGLDGIPWVTDFLVGRDKVESLNLMLRPQVILRQREGEIELGVYLGDMQSVNGSSMESDVDVYAVLVEEISHFIYLFWNLTHGQSFSLLDVEVQGEIDKFLLVADQLGFSDAVIAQLFGRYLLRKDLPLEEEARYHKAHKLGKCFIKKVLKRDLSRCQMLDFLRSFYRKGSVARIKQIYKMQHTNE